jgi:hypothetical protein
MDMAGIRMMGNPAIVHARRTNDTRNASGKQARQKKKRKKRKATRRWLFSTYLEARAGVEPAYTALQAAA